MKYRHELNINCFRFMEFATNEDMKRCLDKMDGTEMAGREVKLEAVKIKSRSRSRRRSS